MGRDKALMVVDGSTMIEKTVASLATANLEPIRIAVARPEDVEEYGLAIGFDFDIEWVLDSMPHAGPIDAIEETLLDPECGHGSLQLATVDYPWISSDLFLSLQEGLCADDFLIMPHDGDRSHPLLSLIRTEEVLEIIKGDRRPLRIQFAEAKHSVLMEDPSTLINVNTPEDLK